MTTLHVRRRLVCLWLPFMVMGMIVYLVSFAATLTINGLGILGLIITGLGVFAAAYDSGEDS